MVTSSQAVRHPAARRWALLAALTFMMGIGLVLLFLLTTATGNRLSYERHFGWLVGFNLTVAAVLLLIIVWLVARLVQRLRRGRFGSRLLAKIAAIFAMVGIVPGVLIYTVSYQFVSRSIESWFDVRVESALEAGVNLGRTALDTQAADWAGRSRQAAAALAGLSPAGAGLALERWREQLGASDLVLWGGSGQPVAAAGRSRFDLSPQRPSASQLRAARDNRVATRIEGLDGTPGDVLEPQVRVLAAVPPGSLGWGGEWRFLEITAPLPAPLVADALAVQEANREYQERALARDGLRRMYIGTLTLALFLTVFGAVLLAVILGNQLLRPLLVLAEGMREVAEGNLGPKPALTARDELASLTRSFAGMTEELALAREAAHQSMVQLDTARANLQTILDNLTAGVIVLDERGHLRSVNPGASRILKINLGVHLGRPWTELPGLEAFTQGAWQRFERQGPASEGEGQTPWQASFELGHRQGTPFDHGLTLIARGAWLPNGERLLVFDDVSDMVSAQRAKAWGEVARRLAHEIKNPLTPIQLSAERLAMKLQGKLSPAEQAMLDKSVRTIVDQVDAMKRLVNEFRDYARLPAASLQAIDLNALLRDIMALYDQAPVRVTLELEEGLPPVMADAQQMRQVVHNLVQNAQDAMVERGRGAVRLITRAGGGRWVRLLVQDDGPGFAPSILERAFEPYVTTKARGTGLGLAVVHKIMQEHGGRIDLSNRVADGQVLGAQVSLSLAVAI